MKYRSVFDIIGPVMVGPSSSHTAGAARIGLMAGKLFGRTPRTAHITFYGSFADTYRGHGTDVAIVGGIMGFDTF
ncbi:MAG: L-serine ammonia-lyase, iron-sulfur-dependent, subunit beta, partial [Exiguobacterium sp.]|nr:L-serine ammonia-lyase, iron-sulfur-dependent, subunit beta [Exiguobacterium sp.]